MLTFAFAFVPADDLASDPRLTVPVPLEERYLALPELAKRLSAATQAEVKIDGPLLERKVSVFVEGHPASETMRMAARVFDARWVKIGPEWLLRADPKIAADDAEKEKVEKIAIRDAMVDWLRRETQASKVAQHSAAQALGALVATVGSTRLADAVVMTENPFYASNSGLVGPVRIDAASAFSNSMLRGLNGPIVPKDAIVRLILRKHQFEFVVRSAGLGDAQMTANLIGLAGVPAGSPIPPHWKFDQRNADWAKELDPAVGLTPLKPAPPLPDPYGQGTASLADILRQIHKDSGVPILAESFRIPIRKWAFPTGPTVMLALQSALKESRLDPFSTPENPLIRTESGWLLSRFVCAWTLRPGEIPERLLTPLEKKRPDLADFARLAGQLTPKQREVLEDERPLAEFSVPTLRKGFEGFWIYDALPLGLRSPEVPVAKFPPLALERWQQTMLTKAFDQNGSLADSWLDTLQGEGARSASFSVRRWLDPKTGEWAGWDFVFGQQNQRPIFVFAPYSPKAP